MVDVGSALHRLSDLASELDTRSKELGMVERNLEPIQRAYDEYVSDFETSAWDRHVSDDGEKLPSQDLRVKLARRVMPPDIRDRHDTLQASRRRLEKRISSLKAEVDAQRSILSALKTEMEATQT